MTEASTGVFGEFCSAGLWPGLGRTLARRLADAGIAAPEHVTAGRLELVEGVGPKRAERLAAAFGDVRPCYEVAEILVPYRVPAKFASGAVTHLGSDAASQLRVDPWRLLALPEIRPDQADYFARQVLNGQAHPQDPRRGRALVVHLLARAARDGHTAMPIKVVASSLIGFGFADPAPAIEAALDEGTVFAFDVGEVRQDQQTPGPDAESGQSDGPHMTLLALARYALAEEAVADGLTRLAATAEPLTGTDTTAAPADDDLDETQRSAVLAIAEHGVCVLTGGPGTGKSRTVAAVVALASARELRIALAAPTGRAAKRLEELTGTTATTLHRLLGAQGRGRAGGGTTTGGATEGAGGQPGWVFSRGEDWPLDADLVVVDEVSMLDVELAAALVEACADGTRLLLVGDPAQLPSIGPGRVLADIIDSGAVPVIELRTLYRQEDGGVIARLATAVRGGELPAVDSPEREVVIVPAREGREAAHRVVQLVTDSIPRALGIGADDIQVVTPVHRGAAGTIELNKALKARLNPGDGAHGGFDPGDRVVAIANHVDEGFANGEVGVVSGTSDEGLVVAFAGGPVTVPPRFLSDLRHGWALTVHRAQGSEWQAVVIVLPGDAVRMLSRPLVYTAMTRAKRHLSVVHGVGPALARAVRTVGERPRRTRLADLLRSGDS